MSDKKMREEFEAWVKDDIGVDCSKIPYGKFNGDIEPQYHNESDADGALIVSAMLSAWKASRAALCVELPDFEVDCGECHYHAGNIKTALDDAGVRYK